MNFTDPGIYKKFEECMGKLEKNGNRITWYIKDDPNNKEITLQDVYQYCTRGYKPKDFEAYIKAPHYESSCTSNNPKENHDQLAFLVLQNIKNTEDIDNLSDEQILDIWTHRLYGVFTKTKLKVSYMKRFNELCKKSDIIIPEGYSIVRTVPFPPPSEETFYIGKPTKNGNSSDPAATAKVKNSTIEDDNLCGVGERVNKDAIHEMVQRNYSNQSTVYIIDIPDGTTKGFDWSISVGRINETNFGSGVFRAEVDDNGYSTEVNFPADTKFKRTGKKDEVKTIEITDEDGTSLGKATVTIVYITPIHNHVKPHEPHHALKH